MPESPLIPVFIAAPRRGDPPCQGQGRGLRCWSRGRPPALAGPAVALGLALAACVAGRAWGADFDIAPGGSGSASAPSSDRGAGDPAWIAPADVPVWLDAGDVPTAYMPGKYALRTDMRFYDGGGVLGKAYLGIFSRLFVGGALDLPNFVGPGNLTLNRDQSQVLARLAVLTESRDVPALAVGWDGPSYFRTPAKGLYVAASKLLLTDPCVLEVHGGVDSGENIQAFAPDRDLRADAAVTASVGYVGAFTSLDDVLDPLGPRWCAGVQVTLDPVTLGLEFQDLASVRPGVQTSRLLRVSWNGTF